MYQRRLTACVTADHTVICAHDAAVIQDFVLGFKVTVHNGCLRSYRVILGQGEYQSVVGMDR